MDKTPEFPTLLRLIAERSTAFRATVASAADLDVQVPTCPEWTLFDLVQHLGHVHRRWAAIVAAGPDATPPAKSAPAGAPAAPQEREALLVWSAARTEQLLAALRRPARIAVAGRGGGVAVAADLGRRRPAPAPGDRGAHVRRPDQPGRLPAAAATATGVDEFLTTCCATTAAWPHEPAVVDYHAAEGRSWRLWLSADGARTARLPVSGTTPVPDTADASARGTAGDLVLAMYGRIPVDSLELDGDRRLFDLLVAWNPDA